MRKTWTPRQLAGEWQVSYDHVLDLITVGAINAIDVASPGTTRARYRIRDEDRREYEEANRAVKSPVPAAVLRRSQRNVTDVISFF